MISLIEATEITAKVATQIIIKMLEPEYSCTAAIAADEKPKINESLTEVGFNFFDIIPNIALQTPAMAIIKNAIIRYEVTGFIAFAVYSIRSRLCVWLSVPRIGASLISFTVITGKRSDIARIKCEIKINI